MAKPPTIPPVSLPTIESLSLGFRSAYLDYERMTAQLRNWANAYPHISRLQSLGQTPQGRDIWLLVVGQDPDRRRPAAWIDGNMHAIEVAGSSVALAVAEDVLRLHTVGLPDLSGPLAARLRDVLFYIVPRISPDGAENILRTGHYVRSVPRDNRIDQGAAKWLPQDIDGNGTALSMRVVSPAGELVESQHVPGLLVERTIDDVGPFYKLYPEAMIANFDGKNIPTPYFLGHSPIDLNRNFPWSWAPGHEQPGAGPFATSEPESRAIVEFASAHPEIFAWVNLHTFGGVVIRPLGHGPDSKMNQEDLAIFRQLEAWMTQFTGYPTVSGYDEFLYEPDKPLRGDLSDYAYNQRGALSVVVELWDLFKRLGMERPAKFVHYYERASRSDLENLARWDKEHNGGRIFVPWRTFMHPQLGAVEVGGIDPRIGIWNPSLPELAAVCDGQSAAFLRIAALAPALSMAAPTITLIGNSDIRRVELRIENHGYLATYGIPSAKNLDFNEPVYAKLRAIGCELVDLGQAHQVIGHLDGWGHGLHTGQNMPAYPQTRGSTNAGHISVLIKGQGMLKVSVGSARMGFGEHEINIEG
jgi:hypothetical protein